MTPQPSQTTNMMFKNDAPVNERAALLEHERLLCRKCPGTN